MYIINGIVHTMAGPLIESGYVAMENGKLTAVGDMSQLDYVPEGTIDAQGGHIFPGMIDAHTHIGVFGDSLGFEDEDGNEMVDPWTPQVQGLDAINALDRCFPEARMCGITTVLTGPGSANPIGGQFAAIKTTGRWADEMVIQSPISMKMALGENPKRVYNARKESPMTRMGTASIIRDRLTRAQEYLEKKQSTQPPAYDGKLEALLPVIEKKLPVHIHAHRADDIATAVRLCQEFDLNYVIVHGTECHLIPELIAQAGVSVITGPNMTARSKPEVSNRSITTPAVLHKAGVKVAICTDHPVIPIQYLPVCAAMAVRGGLEPEEALAAITINAAEIAGIDQRVGSLEVGKDADVVVSTAHPLDWNGQVTHVFIQGVQMQDEIYL